MSDNERAKSILEDVIATMELERHQASSAENFISRYAEDDGLEKFTNGFVRGVEECIKNAKDILARLERS